MRSTAPPDRTSSKCNGRFSRASMPIDFDMGALFHRAVTISVAGHPMKTPSLEDLLLVLSAHAAKHVWGRLIWLCDIARLISLPTLNWTWVGSQAQALGIGRIVNVTMHLANRLLGVAIPAAARENIAEDASVPLLVDEIQLHIASDEAYNVESLAYFRLMMRLRERPTDQRRFLRRLVFTPRPQRVAGSSLARTIVSVVSDGSALSPGSQIASRLDC